MLPKDIAKMVPKTHLMSEAEWRAIGVQQSQGWIHYMMHEPGNDSCCVSDIQQHPVKMYGMIGNVITDSSVH